MADKQTLKVIKNPVKKAVCVLAMKYWRWLKKTIGVQMTDKQIIIDGVDVSGCECYSEHREGYCGWHTPCEGDTCPYKLKWALDQLKAKEQECKRLKEGYSELTDIVSPYMNDFTGYNEELDSFDIILCIKELLKEKSDLKEYRLQELEYIRTMLVCLLANEENAKQAHKVNHLINEIIKWQNLEDK